MPELAEVMIYCDSINKYVKSGSICLSMSIQPTSRYFGKQFQGQELLNFPARFIKSTNRGKKIIIHFESLANQKKFYLVISVLLTGVIRFTAGDSTSVILTFEEEGKEKNIWLDDVRRLGILEGFDSEEKLNERLNKIGPDLFDDEVTIEDYTNLITNKRRAKSTIYSFLMNQKYISGIGNYLAAEILYASRISPFRQLKDLSTQDIVNLYNFSKSKIRESYEVNGFSLKDYFNPILNEPGTFKCLVYSQKVDPLGNEVIRSKMKNGRTAHWVPSVQQ